MSAIIAQPLEFALQCHARGDYTGAERYFQEAIDADPQNVQAVHCAGVLALQAGNFPLAEVRLRRALQLGATLPGTHFLLGRALKGQGDVDGAIASYRRTLEADRDMAEAHISLGLALKDKGHLEDAISSYRSALSIKPESFEARINLANTLQLQGKLDEALEEYGKVALIRPESPQVHFNMGKTLRAKKRDAEALERFQRAVTLDQDFLEAYFNMGNTLTTLGHYAAAIECFRHLQELIETGAGYPINPAARELLNRNTITALAAPLVWAARFDEAAPLLQEALAREPDAVILNEFRLVMLPYRCESQAELLDIYSHYQRITPMRFEQTLIIEPRAGNPQKLRIGYLSGDLRDHSMAFFLEPLFANHDRQSFEILCYSTNRESDAVTERLKTHTDVWLDARDMDDTGLVQRIMDDGVDVLIDLSGRTVQNRLGVFAKRPAWLQVGYLGYPTYTGVPQIDYRVTDAIIDPPGDRGRTSERPLRLPRGMFCYRPPADAPERARTGARERDHICFGSFNQLQKLSPAVLDAWARILAGVPDSRLLLKASGFNDTDACRRVIEIFVRAGIAPERVMIRAGIAERREHLALYGEVDIALDTYPYNGATTSCEALWMGTPVITLAGETHASRMGASILTTLGLPELIAHSTDAYIALAMQLAGERRKLDELHNTLRQRFADSPLRDEAGFASAFEQLLHKAWRSHAADQNDTKI